jgi:hypothetical protein
MSPFPLRSFNTLFKEITDLDALYEERSKLPEVIILLEYTLQSARQSHIASTVLFPGSTVFRELW